MVRFYIPDDEVRDVPPTAYSETLGVDVPYNPIRSDHELNKEAYNAVEDYLADRLGGWVPDKMHQLSRTMFSSLRAPDETMYWFMDNAPLEVPQEDIRELESRGIEPDPQLYELMTEINTLSTKVMGETFGDIVIYRGVGGEFGRMLRTTEYRKDAIEIVHNFAESWTSDVGQAEIFAVSFDGGNGVYMRGEVEPQEVFMPPYFRKDGWGESEYVVMYQSGKATITYRDIFPIPHHEGISSLAKKHGLDPDEE